MKTRATKLIPVLALVLALFWAGPVLAKKDSSLEKKAGRLWASIKAHLDGDRELEACRLAVKMAPYQETKAYAEAARILDQRGISIQDPLLSWTSKAIVRAQNMVERSLLREGDIKHIGILPEHLDAWGTPLRVEMVEMGEYLYMVRSAGPDKKYMTGDDPIIGGLKPKGVRLKTGKGRKGDSSAGTAGAKPGSKGPTLKSLLRESAGSGPDRTSGGDGGTAPDQAQERGEESLPREEVVELEELIEKTE